MIAKVIVREKYDTRDKRNIFGRIVEIVKRATNKLVGTLVKHNGRWVVMPDGNIFKTPVEIPALAREVLRELPAELGRAAGVLDDVNPLVPHLFRDLPRVAPLAEVDADHRSGLVDDAEEGAAGAVHGGGVVGHDFQSFRVCQRWKVAQLR